jgi:tellurite resistance protein TerA
MRVNLNWNARPAGGGVLPRLAGGGRIDLDLGCLYEYTDGSKGVVQALGNDFHDVHTLGPSPIAWLDGDDRSGANSGGENLFIDLRHLHSIKRILVFTYIYEGIPNWAAADAVVTLYPTAGPQIEVRLDEADPRAPMCAIAVLRNVKDELTVKREMKYIRGFHDRLSRPYRWGLRWTPGLK